MRTFTSEDGKTWVATLHDGIEEESGVAARTGWEVIQFDAEQPGAFQRITYRPSGWLNDATIQDLIAALREGESVRANWNS